MLAVWYHNLGVWEQILFWICWASVSVVGGILLTPFLDKAAEYFMKLYRKGKGKNSKKEIKCT